MAKEKSKVKVSVGVNAGERIARIIINSISTALITSITVAQTVPVKEIETPFIYAAILAGILAGAREFKDAFSKDDNGVFGYMFLV